MYVENRARDMFEYFRESLYIDRVCTFRSFEHEEEEESERLKKSEEEENEKERIGEREIIAVSTVAIGKCRSRNHTVPNIYALRIFSIRADCTILSAQQARACFSAYRRLFNGVRM